MHTLVKRHPKCLSKWVSRSYPIAKASIIYNPLYKASALWADAFYKSKCPYVCLCVCVSVCVFTFEVPFKRLFLPTS